MLVGLVATLIGRTRKASATNMRALRIPSALFALCLRALTISALAFGSLSGAEKPTEAVSRATLENGLRVVVIHSSLAPVVTTVMNYLAGSNEAPQGFPGMAHALEHMMFRGSPGLSADQLANVAATMGGDFNADTQQVVTQFFFTVPKQDLDVALHIESIRMSETSLQRTPSGTMSAAPSSRR